MPLYWKVRKFADTPMLPLRTGGKGLTILSQQCADSSLLRGKEAKQKIWEFCHIETEIDNSGRAGHDAWLRPSEAFVLSTDIARQARC